jgi:anti-sigma factor RsiW
MAQKHPDELELLAFVEEEVDGEARQDLAEHLVACRSCADQVRRLEAGREALRSAPMLELPDERHAEIMASLPERRDPWRLFRPAKRALVIAAPVAAAAALVGVFVVGGNGLGGGGDEEAATPAAQEEATVRDQSGGAMESAPQLDRAEATLVRRVEGPAEEVVRTLTEAGISARVDLSGAVVADGRLADVRAALAGRAAGDVSVYVR